MLGTTVFPGRYVQGHGAIESLGSEMTRFGRRALVVSGPVVSAGLLPGFLGSIEEAIDTRVAEFGGECTEEEIARLSEISKQTACEVIAGVGGGKTLDTAKAVADEVKRPVVVVPTIASTDAPCSAISVIYTPSGGFKRYLFLPKNPDLVLVDTGIIASAPVRFLVSGMGDALATRFEAESCRAKHAKNTAGGVGTMTSYALARLCYETLLEHGVAAKLACEAHVVTPALDHIVEANTLLSGLGFESGGLAAAHAIHNGLTVLEGTHGSYHGEKVTIGVLASLILTDKPKNIIDEVFSFCEAMGLPTTLADIGLKGVSDEELMEVSEAACAEGETIHNEPIPVVPRMVLSALRALDAHGRYRKKSRVGQ
ncbi:MAG: glycerol dehydrogenase [Deltaproteobacteria bacterium]|nr:glycerol dehydrogenase [Deltaproteobacteria bacterium]